MPLERHLPLTTLPTSAGPHAPFDLPLNRFPQGGLHGLGHPVTSEGMTEAEFLRSTRVAYDKVVEDYTDVARTELANKPLDRAMLATFAELVGMSGPIADVGCGPGHVTIHLDSLGAKAFGIDLSPQMIATARRDYPHLQFDVGSMTALDLADESLGGLMSWYSLIHIPPEHQPDVLAEFHRVITPGGYLLLAFQIGNERRHITQAYQHEISLDAYRLPPAWIAKLLTEAGFVMYSQTMRQPDSSEKVPQAYLIATKPSAK